MGKLDGKVAVITGAARGIGHGIAHLFAREGADVGVVDLHGDGARAAAREIGELGRRSIGVQADVSTVDGVEQAFAAIQEQLGTVDVLVNNVGIATATPVLEMSVEEWDRVLQVDLRSVFLCTRAVLPAMIERRSGRIISISSQIAYKGAPTLAHYAAAKAAIIGFTRSLALEVAQYNVLPNVIAPGPVGTESFYSVTSDEWRKAKLAEIPLHRVATVEEIAPSALLLASEDGSYYVGATLSPNGGDVMV